VSYPPNSTPSAQDTSWTTPDRPGTMPVTPSLATHETAETPDPIVSPGYADAKADDVSATVSGAVAAAQARFRAHEASTHPQGSVIGTLVDLPPVVSDYSKKTGGSDATAYDPCGLTD
jgi:hypothetical protein